MATKKISELNALTTPESDDLIAIVDASATETKKITYGNISKHIVNVGTEVEEDSRVNFIHSKNLYHCDYVATKNQVTSTYNGSTLTINGTTRGDFFNVAFSEIPKLKLKAGTYTLSVHFDSGTKTGTQSIVLRNYSTTTNIIDATLVDGYSNSFTLNSDTEVIACLYLRAGSQTLTNFKMNIQIEQGNQATSYEPYNIPNQIVVDNETFTDTIKVSNEVDGKSRVNVIHSRNLFNKDNVNKINAYLPSSTGAIGSNASAITIYIPCEKNTIYTISKGVSDRFIVGTTINVPAVGVESTFIVRDDSATLKTITTGNDANYLCIYYSASNQNIDNTIIIEKGSSIITSSIAVDNETFTDTIKVGTNVDSRSRVNVLKSKNKVQLNNIYMQHTIDDNNGNLISNVPARVCIFQVKVKPNTQYIISCANGYLIGNIFQYNESKTYTTKVESEYAISKQYISSSTTHYITFILKNTDNTTIPTSEISNIKVQVEEGNIETTYEPYTPPSINVDGENEFFKNTYSTSEVVIGEWFGKPLYRRVIKTTTPSTASSTADTIVTLGNISLDTLTSIKGIINYAGTTWRDINAYQSSSLFSFVDVLNDSGIIRIRQCCTGSSYLSKLEYITLEYTKTTD